MSRVRNSLWVLWFLIAIPSISSAEPERIVRIGVRSLQSSETVKRAWGPTADFLSSEIAGTRFEIVRLTGRESHDAVVRRTIDFLLTDPAEFVELEVEAGLRAILTEVKMREGVACDKSGSVIIKRTIRNDINELSDLEGKSYAAIAPSSFDGWIAARHELMKRGLSPHRDFAEVRYLGSPEAVVQAVRNGDVDAGVLGSDDFARLARTDAGLDPSLSVVEPQLSDRIFPLESTTPLFPDWPLTALRQTEEHLAKRVVLALLSLDPKDPACVASGIQGWTIPLNYGPVHEILRDLRLPPYRQGRVKFEEAVREYRGAIAGAIALILALAGGIGYAMRLYRSNAHLSAHLKTQLAERERAERALRESEALYHSLVETLPQNIFRKGCDERFTFVNRRFCAIVGKSAIEILGRTDSDLFPEELAQKYRADDARVMAERTPYETVERHITPDGETRYVHVIKSPLVDAEGQIAGVQGIFWDVTGKRRAEEELARSEERFSLAVRGSNDGLWDWNIETGEVYYSPRFKELLGYADHELPNTVEAHLERIHPEDRLRVETKIRNHLRERAPFDVEYRMKTRSGEYLWFHVRGQALWNAEGRATRMAGSLSDITSRRMSEDKLRTQNVRLQQMARSERLAHQELKQAQSRMVSTAKLAGLGEMVAGVAHEINNPLSFVSNNVCVLQRDLGEVTEVLGLYRQCEPILEQHAPDRVGAIRTLWDGVDMDYTLNNLPGLLNRTRDGLKRIQQIVMDLRVFARLDESDLNEVDLNAGIESTVNIVIGHAKKKQVKIDLQLQDLPLVTCYPAKINQVVMNLVSNAIDASPENGVITLRTLPVDRGVVIEVQDRGTGIPPEVRERIFDPFFTTKPIGVGTGLGLSISYGILQDHGGSIDVESSPGLGTTFRVTLPLTPGSRPRPIETLPVEDGTLAETSEI